MAAVVSTRDALVPLAERGADQLGARLVGGAVEDVILKDENSEKGDHRIGEEAKQVLRRAGDRRIKMPLSIY